MELSLIEKTEHTKIKVGIEKLKTFASFIHGYIDKYGGREINRNSRFAYFEINANLLNSKRKNKNGQ